MFDIVRVVAIVFSLGLPAFIVWIVVSRRHQERIELIRQGVNPDSNVMRVSLPGDNALRWGLIFLAVGLAGSAYLAIVGLKFMEKELFLALAFTLIGVALLVFYRLTAESRRRIREIQEKLLAEGKVFSYQRLTQDDGER